MNNLNCSYDDGYDLHLTYVDGTQAKSGEAKLNKSVSNYFDESGQLCMENVKKDVINLLTSISTKKLQ